MKQLERHPLSKLWPDIPENQFADLKADIEKHGQRYPIIVYAGEILDGWHRYKACAELKTKPTIEKFSGTPQAAAEMVNSLNAHRRNVSEGQRAFAITGSYQWAEGQARGVARATPVSKTSSKAATCDDAEKNGPKTNREMAALAGTGQDTIIRAKKVHESGSKALKDAVQSGKISVNKAAAVVDLPKSEQLAAATAPKKPSIEDDNWAPEKPDMDALDDEADRNYRESQDKVIQSDDRLASMDAQLKRQAKEIANLKASRDGFMDGKNAVLDLLKKEQRKTARLEKELKKAEDQNESLRERIAIMEAA